MSFFAFYTLLNSTLLESTRNNLKTYTQKDVDNAWIQVPWNNGGYYYHNTITREDRDHPPSFKYKKYEL